jgi:hypothetical protein
MGEVGFTGAVFLRPTTSIIDSTVDLGFFLLGYAAVTALGQRVRLVEGVPGATRRQLTV